MRFTFDTDDLKNRASVGLNRAKNATATTLANASERLASDDETTPDNDDPWTEAYNS